MSFVSTRIVTHLSAAVCCALLTVGASAQDGPQQRGRGPRKPPQEAYTACAERSAGDDCTVELRERTIEGSCVEAPEDGALFCGPDHPPGPPAGAREACSSKRQGDSCTAPGPDGNGGPSGTCEQGPDGQLGCRPAAPPS